MVEKNLKNMNLQLFADGDEDETGTGAPIKPEAPPAQPQKQFSPQPQGKTFSEDYVQALREEAKGNRIAKKNLESKLRDLIGLKPDEDLSDDRINGFKTAQDSAVANALRTANDRLLKAEIKSLEGYDSKLLERLLDKTKITIEDDGTVVGLKEAAAEIEQEFPQVRIAVGDQLGGGTNPAHQKPLVGLEALQEALNEAIKNRNLPEQIALKQRIFEAERSAK